MHVAAVGVGALAVTLALALLVLRLGRRGQLIGEGLDA